jgi:hypothetical protein
LEKSGNLQLEWRIWVESDNKIKKEVKLRVKLVAKQEFIDVCSAPLG